MKNALGKFPSVCGIFPTARGIFPEKKTEDNGHTEKIFLAWRLLRNYLALRSITLLINDQYDGQYYQIGVIKYNF